MKINNFFLRFALMAMMLSITTIAFGTTGDFGAWNLTTVGHNGLNAGILTFTEKNMTLESWFYIDDAGGNNLTGANAISNRHNGNQGFSVNLANNSATSTVDVRFVFKNTKNDGTSDQAFAIFLPRSAFSNQWGHFAFVISSEEHRAYAYLNGQLYNVIEDFYTDWVGNRVTDQLWIGRWYTNDPIFYGKMADIRVWTVARTAEDIAENYNKRLKGDETGLYIYYNFDNFDKTILNVANPGTNNGSLLPDATWSAVHSYEVLSEIPVNLSIGNNMFTWDGTGDSYEIEISEKETENIVNTGTSIVNSYSLSGLGLSTSLEYNLKVRAKKNQFYSDWASINLNGPSAVSNPNETRLTIYTENNSIIVNSVENQTINVLAYDGRIVRTVELNVGKTTISGLSKGLYIIDRQKIIIK